MLCPDPESETTTGLDSVVRIRLIIESFSKFLLSADLLSAFPVVCGTMGTQLERALFVSLFFCFLFILAQGLEIPDPEHIAYIHQKGEAVVNGTVSLHCGAVMPTLFIWVFSKNGSDGEAVAYNYGLGPKILPLASTLGDALLTTNTSTLLLERVQAEAEGLYNCQAIYDTDDGPRVTFYYTQLSLQGQQKTAKKNA
ncbi:hypothetical protein SRHO_G00081280 [Serrasalmus rhombeus]